MFKNINQQFLYAIEFWSATPRLLFLVVLFFVLNMIVLPSFQSDLMIYSNGTGVLDLLPMYTPEEAFQRLNAYTAPGRKLYLIAEWTGDLIYPPVYGFMFAGILFKLGGKTWSTLPVYSFLVDYIENIFLTIMLTSFPRFSPGLSQVSSLCTSLKWLLAFANILMILGFSVQTIFKWIKRRQHSRTKII